MTQTEGTSNTATENANGAPAPALRARTSLLGAPWIIVSLLTVLGAGWRFMYLDHPPIWGDESATFARVCGTFDELKEELSTVGHAPLHYLIYWTIAQRRTIRCSCT